jgi:hypothetical protein
MLKLSFFIKVEHSLSRKCEKLFKENCPRDCVDYPLVLLTKEYAAECSKSCFNRDKNLCCLAECMFKMYGILVNGKFYADKLLVAFEPFFKCHENCPRARSKDVWMSVIKKSIKKAEKICKLITNRNL